MSYDLRPATALPIRALGSALEMVSDNFDYGHWVHLGIGVGLDA